MEVRVWSQSCMKWTDDDSEVYFKNYIYLLFSWGWDVCATPTRRSEDNLQELAVIIHWVLGTDPR